MKPGIKKVLICPMDWGLGHASRLIPVINKYLIGNYNVIIGGSGISGELLKKTFPRLTFEYIPSWRIRYPSAGSMVMLSIFFQLPFILFSIIREKILLKKLIRNHGIDIVVSDNRYGLHNSETYNIFITHQISPVLPFFFAWAEYPLYLIIRKMILRFNECWIPDYADPKENLSGNLSHRYDLPQNARFIGILSRFAELKSLHEDNTTRKYDIVIILSGPQPMLTAFTKKILLQLQNIKLSTLVISGMQNTYAVEDSLSMVKIVPHMEIQEFQQTICHASVIICRSGYSGIMDLISLQKKAILIPTPGQPEQQYLAKYLTEKGLFASIKQDEFDIQKATIMARNMNTDRFASP